MNDLNLFKKNGFLVKENLISQSKINKINKIVNEVTVSYTHLTLPTMLPV